MINETKTILGRMVAIESLFALHTILGEANNEEPAIKTAMYEKMWSLIGNLAADNDKSHFPSIEPLINDKFPDLKSFFSIDVLKDLFQSNAPQQHKTNIPAFQYIVDNLHFSDINMRREALMLCFNTPSNRDTQNDLPYQVFRDIFYHSPDSEKQQLFIEERIQKNIKEHKYYSFLQDNHILNEYDVEHILNANMKNDSHSFKKILADLKQYNIYGDLINKNIINNVIKKITTPTTTGSFSNKLNKKDLYDQLTLVNNWKMAKDEKGASLYHYLAINYASYFNTFPANEIEDILNITDNKGLKPVDYFVLNGFQNSKDVNEYVINKMIENGIHSTTKVNISYILQNYRDLIFKANKEDKEEKYKDINIVNKFIQAFSLSWLNADDILNSHFTRHALSNHLRGFVRSLSRENYQQLDKNCATVLLLLNSYGDQLNEHYGKPGILFEKVKGLGLCVTPEIEKAVRSKGYELKYLDESIEILKEDYAAYERDKLHENLNTTSINKIQINRI